MKLLCDSCELKFSVYEKYFVEEIFKSVNDTEFPFKIPKGFDYDDKLFYFIVSVW